MNPELQQAVRERIELGYNKEKIAAELRAVGYDDATIDNVYALVSRPNTAAGIPDPLTTGTKETVSPWLVGLAPFGFLIAIVVVWGIINLLTAGSASGSLDVVNTLAIPFLIGLSFLAIPICIIVAVVMAFRRYDGVIHCENCNYHGVGEAGRSDWAQVLAWVAFFIFWPITLGYYVITHKYRCPSCKSTVVSMRDKNGHYSRAGVSSTGVAVVVFAIVGIAVVGIIAAVILASIGSASDRSRTQSDLIPVIPGMNL